jgi:hypothetical protein
MLTNYQQLIISLAPYAAALAQCDPALLTGYTQPPRVQLIKTAQGNNIRVMVAPDQVAEFFKNYGVDLVGPNLAAMLSLTPDALIDLDSIATGCVDILFTGTCEQLQSQCPMKSDIVCYDPKHEHLQLLISMNISQDTVGGYTYYSRNFNEEFCVINVYHFDAEGSLLGISTETWYAGASSYHQFNLKGINVYKSKMTGSHRNDLSRIYLNITPPADAEPEPQ